MLSSLISACSATLGSLVTGLLALFSSSAGLAAASSAGFFSSSAAHLKVW